MYQLYSYHYDNHAHLGEEYVFEVHEEPNPVDINFNRLLSKCVQLEPILSHFESLFVLVMLKHNLAKLPQHDVSLI